jgi:hypothetical protein
VSAHKSPQDLAGLFLGLATEDAFGLYELLWHLRLPFQEAEDPLPPDAITAVENLLRQGYVKLLRCTWLSRADQEVEVPTDQAIELVSSPSSWLPPVEDGYFLAIASTAKGDEVYCSKGPF